MFTGIVQTQATITSCDCHELGRRLVIDIAEMPSPIPEIGDSVAVNGACLTVVEINRAKYSFDVSSETLSRTLVGKWVSGDRVNIEKALTLTAPLGGHLVSGHVDGVGTLVFSEETGSYRTMRFRIARELAIFLSEKGSIAIDGVSLTINSIADDRKWTEFNLMLVPHTLMQTTLGELAIGDSVHIEVDQIARYIHRMNNFNAD